MKFAKITPLTVSVALGAIAAAFTNAYTAAAAAASASGAVITSVEWGQIVIACVIAAGAVLFHDNRQA